jgi:hypothetical protein
MNISSSYNSQGIAFIKNNAGLRSGQGNVSSLSFADCLDKASSSQEVRGKSVPSQPSSSTYDSSLASQGTVRESGRSGNIGASGIYGNADPGVMGAWNSATDQTGYNPLVDEEGKLVGSSLMACYMEMEYRLAQEHGSEEARKRMAEIFSDPAATRQLVSNALERANNPLTNNQSEEQLKKERSFYQAYLAMV